MTSQETRRVLPNRVKHNGRWFRPNVYVEPLTDVERASPVWRDERGRDYDFDFHLICQDCGGTTGNTLGDMEGYAYGARTRVSTDKQGRTLCRECRLRADETF